MTRGQFKIFPRRIAGVHAVEAETRHAFPRHTHEQFGIGLIHRGAHKSLSGRGVVEAGAGDTITVNPGEVHDGAPIGDSGRAWRMLYFDPPLIMDALRDIHPGEARIFEFVNPVIRNAAVAELFKQLFFLLTTDDEREATLRREALSLTLLARIFHERSNFDRRQAIPQAIVRARSLIDDDPTTPVTLSDLARESGLSRFQVLRGFVRATGLTPHAYLVQRRIDVARRLIMKGVPLAQAAASSGFADQSHMTRIFVRKYGISPGAYADAA